MAAAAAAAHGAIPLSPRSAVDPAAAQIGDRRFREDDDQDDPEDILEFQPLGAGREVGRSCHILRFKGKTVCQPPPAAAAIACSIACSTGCYAQSTLPSAQSTCLHQQQQMNAIYAAQVRQAQAQQAHAASIAAQYAPRMPQMQQMEVPAHMQHGIAMPAPMMAAGCSVATIEDEQQRRQVRDLGVDQPRTSLYGRRISPSKRRKTSDVQGQTFPGSCVWARDSTNDQWPWPAKILERESPIGDGLDGVSSAQRSDSEHLCQFFQTNVVGWCSESSMYPFKTGLSKFKKRTPDIKKAIEEAKFHISRMLGPTKTSKRKYVRKDPMQKAMEAAKLMHKRGGGTMSSAKLRAIRVRQVKIMRRMGLIPPPEEMFD